MSSIFSILSAGAPPGQTPVAGQTQALEPSGVAFETFLLMAQDRVEYPPSVASGPSMSPEAQAQTAAAGQIQIPFQDGTLVDLPPSAVSGTPASLEAQEQTAAVGQSDFQDGAFLESSPGDLSSGALQALTPHPPTPSEGPANDDWTALSDDPTPERPSSAPGATPMGRPAAPAVQDRGSEPLAASFLASPSEEMGQAAGVRPAERRAASGDGRGESAPGTSLVAPPPASLHTGAPNGWNATGTEAVERGKSAEEIEPLAPKKETGDPSPEDVRGRAPARMPLPGGRTESERGPAASGHRGWKEDARSSVLNACVPAPAESRSGDLLEETGRVDGDPVTEVQETLQPRPTSDETPLDRSPSGPLRPQRKETRPEAPSAEMPPANVSQDAALLSLRMQPPPPAPDAGEPVEDTPPKEDARSSVLNARVPAPAESRSGDLLEETGRVDGDPVTEVQETLQPRPTSDETPLDRSPSGPLRPQRKETRPEAPSAEMPPANVSQDAALLSLRMQPPPPAPDAGGPVEDTPPEVAGVRMAEAPPSSLAPTPETPAFAPTPDPGATAGAEMLRTEHGFRRAAPSGTAPSARGHESLTSAPFQGTPEGQMKRPSDRVDLPAGLPGRPQTGPGGEQLIGPALARPSESGTARVGTPDGEARVSPDGAAPLEARDRTTGINTVSSRDKGGARPGREIEPPDGPTGRTGVERAGAQEAPPSQDSVRGTAAPLTEKPAPEEGREGKFDRPDARKTEEPGLRIDQTAPFTSPPGDPAVPKASLEPGPDLSVSAQHQPAAPAINPVPAGARVHTPDAVLSHPAPPAVPDHPPEAVLRQVIRGARFLLKDDVSEVRIRLEPPELGSVHIRLVSGGDTLSGEIGVSNHDVKGIVESQLHQLRSSLTEQGLHVGHIDVSVRDDQRGGAWSDRAGGFGRPDDAPDDRRNPGRNGDPAWEAREEDRRPRRGQSLVDYFA